MKTDQVKRNEKPLDIVAQRQVEDEEIRRILKRPYARAISPEESGSYFGEIVEFPGCYSSGETAAEALSNLEEVAGEWLRIELDKGHAIPQPIED